MYFFRTQLPDSRWGFQGDGQFRNWDLGGDLEQLLLRGGVTYTTPKGDATFTFGYASITTGEFGSSDETVQEHRIYQEALLPQKIGKRVLLNHRFRFEQRWIETQDIRTRFRYALFIAVPFNRTDLGKGAIYAAVYDEVFLNGEHEIGEGRTVETFDRNRLYGAIGYSIHDRLRFQGGYMYQATANIGKGQLQLSLHHTF
jgi:hypothetical protein